MDLLQARVARNLKELREELGYTQQEVGDLIAEMTGADPRSAWKSYQRWESGTSFPRKENVETLSKIFEVGTSEIYGLHAQEVDIDGLRAEMADVKDQVARLTKAVEQALLGNQPADDTIDGKKVKSILDRHGVTLTELARRMDWLLPDGSPDPTKAGREIGHYGKTRKPRARIEKILRELGVNPKELDQE